MPWQSYTDGEPLLAGAESAQAIDPAAIGPMVVDAIVHDRPYVLTHPLPDHVAERARLLQELAADR